jgi:hypothetical protein
MTEQKKKMGAVVQGHNSDRAAIELSSDSDEEVECFIFL